MIIKPIPEEEAKQVEVIKGPNIKFLPIPEQPTEHLCVPVSLKTVDNITTDDEKNQALYQQYAALAENENHVIFGGRLAEYKYYDMDKVIASALKRTAEYMGD